MQKVILFVCTRNSSRSQMGEAWFNALNKNLQYVGKSAGIEPASQVNPVVVEVMKEKGIDMTGQHPKKLTVDMANEALRIIRMCGKEACVWAPGEKTEDWDVEGPLGKPAEKVRQIRDVIEQKVRDHIKQLP